MMAALAVLLMFFCYGGGVWLIVTAPAPGYAVDWGTVGAMWTVGTFCAFCVAKLAGIPLLDGDGVQRHKWTAAEIHEDLEAMYRELTNTYTPEERRQMEAEETANYVAHIAGYPMREVSYSAGDTVMFWEEYVIDQKGRKHVLRSGETPIMPAHPPVVVYGEVVETPLSRSTETSPQIPATISRDLGGVRKVGV
jgi:hypothetical protein